jgi:hypothetical protein
VFKHLFARISLGFKELFIMFKGYVVSSAEENGVKCMNVVGVIPWPSYNPFTPFS